MHSGPRWDRGRRRRLARIRLRDNWPDRWVLALMALVMLAVGLALAAHTWLQRLVAVHPE